MTKLDSGNHIIDGILNKCYSFVIPSYQRDYAWAKTQYEKFYEQIIDHMNGEYGTKDCFMGFIILKDNKNGMSIVDGQQRLTTISLLLKAIQISLKKDEMNDECNYTYYDINRLLIKDNRTKETIITLHSVDFELYRDIIQGNDVPNSDKKIFQAFNFFCKNFSHKSNLFLIDLYHFITTNLRFQVVTLSEEVNEFEIFQNFNSAGKPLTPGEMWLNSLFLLTRGIDGNETKLLELKDLSCGNFTHLIKCWYYAYASKLASSKFDALCKPLRDIALEIGENNLLNNLLTFGKLYKSVISKEPIIGHAEFSNYLKTAFIDCEEFQFWVTHVLTQNNKRQKPYSDSFLINICKSVENILFRSCICNHTWLTHFFQHGITFSAITNGVGENEIDACLERIVRMIERMPDSSITGINMETHHIIPSDDEMRQALKTIDLYKKKKRNLRAYTLSKIGYAMNGYSKECDNIYKLLSDKSLTIEHIIPQTTTSEWEKELGENSNIVYKEKIHTLSNLTITAYNSEYSNKSFLEKKTMEHGYKDSIYNITNSICKFQCFGLNELLERENELIDLALQIWKVPYLDDIHDLKSEGLL